MADVGGDGEERKEEEGGGHEEGATPGAEKAAAEETVEGGEERQEVGRETSEAWPKQEWGNTGGRRRGRTSKTVSEIHFPHRRCMMILMQVCDGRS